MCGRVPSSIDREKARRHSTAPTAPQPPPHPSHTCGSTRNPIKTLELLVLAEFGRLRSRWSHLRMMRSEAGGGCCTISCGGRSRSRPLSCGGGPPRWRQSALGGGASGGGGWRQWGWAVAPVGLGGGLGRRLGAGSAFGTLQPSRHSSAFRRPRGIVRHSGTNNLAFCSISQWKLTPRRPPEESLRN